MSATNHPPPPWLIQAPDHYLPIIVHKHMIALKWHLMAPTESGPAETSTRSAARLPVDYGRSLRPDTMARDALYSLTEVFALAASSQMQFLNLVDTKLDGYTAATLDPRAAGALPNLRHTKQILYRYVGATRRALDGIRGAAAPLPHPKWPRDTTAASGHRRAAAAAAGVERDFAHLLERAEALDRRATEAVAVLMSSMSIAESQKAIEQAELVGKLTFVAFFFIPLSFTTGFFGMNVAELAGGQLGVRWWVAMSLFSLALALALFYWDVSTGVRRGRAALRRTWAERDRWLP